MTWRWFPVGLKSKWCHLPRSRSTPSVFNAPKVALRWKKVLIEWEQTHWVRTNRQWQWWLERFLGLWLHHDGTLRRWFVNLYGIWRICLRSISVAPSQVGLNFESLDHCYWGLSWNHAYLCLLRPTSLSQAGKIWMLRQLMSRNDGPPARYKWACLKIGYPWVSQIHCWIHGFPYQNDLALLAYSTFRHTECQKTKL